MSFICYNGELFNAGLPVFGAGNRGFKYGDGVFETMRMWNGSILLQDLHLDRLLNSLQTLKINHQPEFIETVLNAVHELCEKNDCFKSAKIRVAAFRGETNNIGFLIEATPLPVQFFQLNTEGWTINVYPGAIKTGDVLANLKSANYLPYVMADLHAKECGLDECFLMNANGFIADGSRTNIFIIKNENVFTPALNQGCVAGVMRRFIINQLKDSVYKVLQTGVGIDLLLDADEVFMTNAVQGIQWVKKFRTKVYGCDKTKQIFDTFFADRN